MLKGEFKKLTFVGGKRFDFKSKKPVEENLFKVNKNTGLKPLYAQIPVHIHQ